MDSSDQEDFYKGSIEGNHRKYVWYFSVPYESVDYLRLSLQPI